MLNKETIGKRLKEERLKAGVSLETLVQDTGIARSTLSRYESEGVSDIEKINDICIALNISPEIILDFNQDKVIENNVNEIIYDKDNVTIITEEERFVSGLKQIDCSIKMNKNIICLSNNNKIFAQKFEDLKKNNYDIRLLDFVNLNADGYSPLQYIKNDRDIVEFTNQFIVKTHKKNDISILFCALIAYLLKYRPKNEQNFISMIKLLITFSECNDTPNTKSVLDRIFDKVEEVDPKGIAIRQYRMFKSNDIFIRRKQVGELLNLLLLYTSSDLEEFIEYDTVQLDDLCDKNKKIAIFAIAPIDNTLVSLYDIFKYQLYKTLKENYLKDSFNTYDKNINKFIEEKKKFRRITYLTVDEILERILSLENEIKTLEMSRHVKNSDVDIDFINKKVEHLQSILIEYKELQELTTQRYAKYLKGMNDMVKNKNKNNKNTN